jgi:hypothetical protein
LGFGLGAVGPFGGEGGPLLKVASGNALSVQIGAPLFDGGGEVVEYTVEWDMSPYFNSSTSPDGLRIPFGFATVRAEDDDVKGVLEVTIPRDPLAGQQLAKQHGRPWNSWIAVFLCGKVTCQQKKKKKGREGCS